MAQLPNASQHKRHEITQRRNTKLQKQINNEHSRIGTAELIRKSEKLCKNNLLVAEQTAE